MDDPTHGYETEERHIFQFPANPMCFCHGERSESPNKITLENASGCGCEWGYVFEDAGEGEALMHILCSYCGSGQFEGQKMIGMFGIGDESATWKIVATIVLDGDEPNWMGVENSVRADEEDVGNA